MRVACVALPALPLQLALRSHPEWEGDPIVVVEDDRPLAPILWANRFAREQRIRTGMKFAQAQSLTARLHAEVVPEERVRHAGARILDELLRFSPRVEPSPESEVFWLDPNGLHRLWTSDIAWAEEVHHAITGLGFVSSVVVGKQRYSVFALARNATGARILGEEEMREAAFVPLARLGVSERFRRDMEVLGVETLGEFLALPRRGLATRYGEDTERLHALASDDLWTPLRPERPAKPVRADMPVEPPDADHARLLFGIKSMLHGIVDELVQRSEGILALRITLRLHHATPHDERIETASPTLNVAKLIDLVRLRLARVELVAPVDHVRIDFETRAVKPQQIGLLTGPPRRDLEAAGEALARVTAAFGVGSVTRAVLRDTTLPEDRFRWEPIATLPEPRARTQLAFGKPAPLVRSVLEKPRPLPDPPRHETERWLGRYGAVESMFGPGRVTSGWWVRRVERDYYWVETKTREILWIYFDRRVRSWFLHGILD